MEKDTYDILRGSAFIIALLFPLAFLYFLKKFPNYYNSPLIPYLIVLVTIIGIFLVALEKKGKI